MPDRPADPGAADPLDPAVTGPIVVRGARGRGRRRSVPGGERGDLVRVGLARGRASQPGREGRGGPTRGVAGASKTDPVSSRPASVVLKPPVTAEERERGRLVGLAAIGCAAVIALVVTVGIFLPALGALTAGGIRPVDAASLPATILVCDREYARAGTTLDTMQPRSTTGTAGSPRSWASATAARAACAWPAAPASTSCTSQTTDDRYAPYAARRTSRDDAVVSDCR